MTWFPVDILPNAHQSALDSGELQRTPYCSSRLWQLDLEPPLAKLPDSAPHATLNPTPVRDVCVVRVLVWVQTADGQTSTATRELATAADHVPLAPDSSLVQSSLARHLRPRSFQQSSPTLHHQRKLPRDHCTIIHVSVTTHLGTSLTDSYPSPSSTQSTFLFMVSLVPRSNRLMLSLRLVCTQFVLPQSLPAASYPAVALANLTIPGSNLCPNMS